jgi:rhodanese-related sulfurtransferase
MRERVDARFEVSAREAREALLAGQAVIVDVRTQGEWEVAHVPGSVHIPLDQIAHRLDEIEVGSRRVFTLCHHGRRSLDAVHILRASGLPGLGEARSIAGGIEAWSLTADPAVPRYVRDATGIRRLP